jgi:hypothetical protein
MASSTRLTICMAAALGLAGCSGHNEPGQPAASAAIAQSSPAATTPATPEADARAAVRKVVERFGLQMQKVSTLAPPEAIRRELPKVYGEVLSPELLADWKAHPDHALGREGSSPWPARIEIEKIECARVDTCRVTGKVDYITSNEVAHGGVFMRRAITLQLARTSTHWRITKVQLEPARS